MVQARPWSSRDHPDAAEKRRAGSRSSAQIGLCDAKRTPSRDLFFVLPRPPGAAFRSASCAAAARSPAGGADTRKKKTLVFRIRMKRVDAPGIRRRRRGGARGGVQTRWRGERGGKKIRAGVDSKKNRD
ncbi:MAG: hypothetical protein NVV65_04155 [Pseudoxanthomonas sp.]|nr:hypothetical protein [Pseudoxanthomonas sp.]